MDWRRRGCCCCFFFFVRGGGEDTVTPQVEEGGGWFRGTGESPRSCCRSRSVFRRFCRRCPGGWRLLVRSVPQASFQAPFPLCYFSFLFCVLDVSNALGHKLLSRWNVVVGAAILPSPPPATIMVRNQLCKWYFRVMLWSRVGRGCVSCNPFFGGGLFSPLAHWRCFFYPSWRL